MVAGELQIGSNFEAQDIYFTFNPQISFYSSVFRRYEKLAIETKILEAEDNTLKNDTDTILTFSIPMNDGDLLKSMYLHVELPDIYSGIMYTTIGDAVQNIAQDFRWIRELGTYLIKNAKLKIGDKLIQELFDEYQDIWKDLHLTDEEKEQYNILTGNIEELNHPYYVNGNEAMGNFVVTGPILNPTFVGSSITDTTLATYFKHNSAFFEPIRGMYSYYTDNDIPASYMLDIAGWGGGTRLNISPNTELSFNGETFYFYQNSYTSAFLNIGNITFNAADTTDTSTLDNHFSKKRITAFGNSNYSVITAVLDNDYTEIQFYNKNYYVPLIFNFTNNTFERTDGEAHGFSNNDTNISMVTTSNNIIQDIGFDTVTNVTATTFQLLNSTTTAIYDGGATMGYQAWQIDGVSYMYNSTTGFWKREDGADHGYSNNDIIQFSQSGFGYSDRFVTLQDYYISNKTAKEFQLSFTLGGSILYSQEIATIHHDTNSNQFQFTQATNSWSRLDGLKHGFSEGEGIYFTAKSLGVGNLVTTVNNYNTLLVKNVTDTTFQLFGYDITTDTETLIEDAGDDLSGDWRIHIIIVSTILNFNNHLTNPNRIQLRTTFMSTTDNIRTIHPIGLSGITTGLVDNFIHTLFFNSSINETDFRESEVESKSIHYPFAKELNNENLFNSELQFSSLQVETSDGNEFNQRNNIVDNFVDTITDSVVPSIEGRVLKIPLYFYFQRDIEKALPIIGLLNSKIKLELILRPIKDLYISKFAPLLEGSGADFISLPYEVQEAIACDIKYNTDYFKTSGIQYFLAGNTISKNTKISGTGITKELDDFIINTKLEYNVIYLSENERRRIVNSRLQYYIETTQKITLPAETSYQVNIPNQSKKFDFKLKSNKPLKELLFVPKRNDSKDMNQWDNFTNNIMPSIPINSQSYSKQYVRDNTKFYQRAPQYIYNTRTLQFPFPYTELTQDNSYKKEFLNKDIIKSITIHSHNDSFKTRTTFTKPGNYYQHQQTSEYYKKKPKDGIYLYSYSLDPTKSIPTGAKFKDFSNSITMNDFNIIIEYNETPDSDNYDRGYYGIDFYSEFKLVGTHSFDLNVYMVEYDILEINNGVGSLLFS